MGIKKIGKGGLIYLTPFDKGDRFKEAAPLDKTMTARHKNRHHERLMAFLDSNGNIVSATALIGSDGKIIDPRMDSYKLDLIHQELEKLTTILTLATGIEV